MSDTPVDEDFWSWWSASAAQIDRAIGAGSVQEWSEELTRRVHAIDDALAWELAPGIGARHQLVVTAEGDPAMRATARRWLQGAPPADATWEYADARQRVVSLEDLGLSVEGQEISLADVVVLPSREGNHFDVAVHHAVFSDPPNDSDKTVTFIALDAAVGELEVETWLGAVEAVAVRPEGAIPLSQLRERVEELANEHVTPNGPSWALLQGETDQGPVIAAARIPLASASAPHLDQHVSVRIGYAERTEAGLPSPEMLEALRILEDQVTQRLEAMGDLVAHETCAGVRELHFYVDSQSPAQAVVEAKVAGWSHGTAKVSAQPDPAWAAVAHLRT